MDFNEKTAELLAKQAVVAMCPQLAEWSAATITPKVVTIETARGGRLAKASTQQIEAFTEIFQQGLQAFYLAHYLKVLGDIPVLELRKALDAPLRNFSYGSHDAGWIYFYKFLQDQFNIDFEGRIESLLELAESCGWYCPFDHLVVMAERPNAPIKRDSRDMLHCEDGPAMSFPGDFKIYKWHGITVPERWIENPETITVDEIHALTNAEMRRVAIIRYGTGRYLIDTKAEVVHELPADYHITGLATAKLLRRPANESEGQRAIYAVDVLNSTPEADGTVKRYNMGIDPDAYGGEAGRNVHAAVASTWRYKDGTLFYAKWTDYVPHVES